MAAPAVAAAAAASESGSWLRAGAGGCFKTGKKAKRMMGDGGERHTERNKSCAEPNALSFSLPSPLLSFFLYRKMTSHATILMILRPVPHVSSPTSTVQWLLFPQLPRTMSASICGGSGMACSGGATRHGSRSTCEIKNASFLRIRSRSRRWGWTDGRTDGRTDNEECRRYSN